MIASYKNNRENYPRKCLWTQAKETLVKFNPGLSTIKSAIEQLGPGHYRNKHKKERAGH